MKTGQKKQILGNTAYTMGGTLVMNGVLQIAIYPLLNRVMGADELGTVLYIMGLVAIVCPSVGQALNNSRLVVRRDHQVANGDYNRLVLFFAIISSGIAIIASGSSVRGSFTIVMTALLLIITSYRYYGDVEYRLSLNYRHFFVYYLLMSVGYLVGFVIYWMGGSWFFIFLTGELAALIFVGIKGSIFRDFWKKSDCFSIARYRGFLLIISYLITNSTLNMDRLVLKHMVGNTAVTQYYVVSLIGKTLVLLVAPINTIVISYLTKREKTMNQKEFGKAAGAGLLVAFLFFIACQIATPIFIKLFYGDLYDSVRSLITVVNLTQILAVLSAFLFILVLTFTEEKWQLSLQVLHLVLMTALVISFTFKGEILGYSYGALIANAVRVILVLILGFVKVRRK